MDGRRELDRRGFFRVSGSAAALLLLARTGVANAIEDPKEVYVDRLMTASGPLPFAPSLEVFPGLADFEVGLTDRGVDLATVQWDPIRTINDPVVWTHFLIQGFAPVLAATKKAGHVEFRGNLNNSIVYFAAIKTESFYALPLYTPEALELQVTPEGDTYLEAFVEAVPTADQGVNAIFTLVDDVTGQEIASTTYVPVQG